MIDDYLGIMHLAVLTNHLENSIQVERLRKTTKAQLQNYGLEHPTDLDQSI